MECFGIYTVWSLLCSFRIYKMQWVTNIATGKKSERDISQEVLLDKPQSAYCLRLYRHPEFYYWYNTDNYCKY